MYQHFDWAFGRYWITLTADIWPAAEVPIHLYWLTREQSERVSTYMHQYMIFVFLFLISLCMADSMSSTSLQVTQFHYFKWLSNIPSYMQMNLFPRQEQRHRHREQTRGHSQEGEGGTNWEIRLDTYTRPCVKQGLVGSCWITQGAQHSVFWRPDGVGCCTAETNTLL